MQFLNSSNDFKIMKKNFLELYAKKYSECSLNNMREISFSNDDFMYLIYHAMDHHKCELPPTKTIYRGRTSHIGMHYLSSKIKKMFSGRIFHTFSSDIFIVGDTRLEISVVFVRCGDSLYSIKIFLALEDKQEEIHFNPYNKNLKYEICKSLSSCD